MPLGFQVEATCGPARAGRMMTAHGPVPTPVFMPVGTVATVKGVPQDTLEELGVEILLGNTYHLYLRPGVEAIRRLGGLHRFMAWDHAILTDSGGFQVFSLSDLRKITEEGVAFRSHLDGSSHFFSAESATAAQIGIGADIIMALDECTEYPAERQRARASMGMTARWAARCKAYFEQHKHEVPWRAGPGLRDQGPGAEIGARSQGSGARQVASDQWSVACNPDTLNPNHSPLATSHFEQALFGIVQGGTYPELRKESAERLIETGFDGYAIGGLSVGEPRTATREMVEATVPLLPADRPRYLMGVGTPEEIAGYAALGVDMMDCVLPTRAARHGLLFTSGGRVNIKSARYAQDEDPLDAHCLCRVCARYSRAYLRHLYASNEVLAMVLNTVHNLAYYLDTMQRVRHSIHSGEFTTSLSGLRSRSLNPPVHTRREDPTFS